MEILALDLGTEWRTLPIAPDYEVSDRGRVRRITAGGSPIAFAGRVLSQHKVRNGYLTCTITISGRQHKMGAHRLVALAFHGFPPSELHQAAHRDGIRDHNTPDNIYWATTSENAADKRRHGTQRFGWDAGPKKFTEEDVRAIRAEYPMVRSQSVLARKYGTSQSHIGRIVRNEVWRYL